MKVNYYFNILDLIGIGFLVFVFLLGFLYVKSNTFARFINHIFKVNR